MALVPFSRGRSSTTKTSSLQDALNEFTAALTEAQLKDFRKQATRPDTSSVFVFVAELDAANQGSKKSISSRLCPFLDGAQQFINVVDTFVSSNPSIAALIWGSIKTSLVVASNAATYFDKVTVLIMEIGRSCPTFDEFGRLFRNHPGVQSSLCNYYTGVIRICTKIVQTYQRSWSAFTLSSIATNFELDFKPLKDELERLDKHLRTEIHLASQQLAHTSSQMIATMGFESRRREGLLRRVAIDQDHMHQSAMKFQILDMLSTDKPEKTWGKIHGPRISGTAEWFKLEIAFQKWRYSSNEASDVLWLCGTLGAGKSVLMAAMISDLQQGRKENDRVAFHFSQKERATSLTADGLIGSITRQLLAESIDKLTGRQLSIFREQHDRPDAVKMIDIMKEYLIVDTVKTYFIVLDGLDECPDHEVSTALFQLNRLCVHRPGLFKFLYSSRPELESVFMTNLKFDIKMTIARKNAEPDIHTYIDEKLRQCIEQRRLTVYSEDQLLTIAEALERDCGGMFLWLTLMIDEICDQVSEAAVLDLLRRLPAKLSDLYNQRLQRVWASGCAPEAVTVLRYAGVTRRPLNLLEMNEAICVKLGDEEFEASRLLRDMNVVVKACHGLLHVDEEDQTLHYIHSSLHSHLFTAEDTRSKIFPYEEVDILLGGVCMTLLELKNFQIPVAKATDTLDTPFTPLDFASLSIHATTPIVSPVASRILRSRRNKSTLNTNELRKINGISSRPLLHQFGLVTYAKEFWYRHVTEINPIDDPAAWQLFDTVLRKPNSLASSPWVGSMTSQDRKDQAKAVITWALGASHFALAYHQAFHGDGQDDLDLQLLVRESFMHRYEPSKSRLLRYFEIMAKTDGVVGRSVLHHTIVKERWPLLCQLLSRKIYTNDLNEDDETPLHVAVRGKLPWPEDIINQLLEAGAGVNAMDKDGRTPLHSAAARTKNLQIVHKLIEAGADVKAMDKYGRTPLHSVVAKTGSREIVHKIVHKLIEAGADVKAMDKDGQTPLHSAAERTGSLEIVHKLIEAGADVKAMDKYGRTPLHSAAVGIGSLEIVHKIVHKLIEAGADVKAMDKDGQTPLHSAAARTKNLQIVHKLIEAGADVNAMNEDGHTPLHCAAARIGSLEIVHKLIEAGADVNAMNKDGHTPLHCAAARIGSLETVHKLIEAGADVNAMNKDGHTPLHYAAERIGSLETVHKLIEAGADVKAMDKYGETPLHFAANKGNLEIVHKLVDAGAEVNAKDRAGLIPSDLAVNSEHADVFKWLSKRRR